MSAFKCPKCKETTSSNEKFCKECGQPLDIICPECGEKWRFMYKYKFCPSCGNDMRSLNKDLKTEKHITMPAKN
ncbi:MAG: zinc ribbon domain-containing protein [Marinifilaceae bacterium]|jgi:predicted amidophosphoribosyltransferase